MEFYDEGHVIKKDLFDGQARIWASQLVKMYKEKPQGVSRHHFRKIFEEIKRLKTLASEETWDEYAPLVKMMKPKTAYTVARAISNNRRVGEQYNALKSFIFEGIDSIKRYEDLVVFCFMVEAVYAYFYEAGGAKLQ